MFTIYSLRTVGSCFQYPSETDATTSLGYLDAEIRAMEVAPIVGKVNERFSLGFLPYQEST